jgi:hypothetical protein
VRTSANNALSTALDSSYPPSAQPADTKHATVIASRSVQPPAAATINLLATTTPTTSSEDQGSLTGFRHMADSRADIATVLLRNHNDTHGYPATHLSLSQPSYPRGLGVASQSQTIAQPLVVTRHAPEQKQLISPLQSLHANDLTSLQCSVITQRSLSTLPNVNRFNSTAEWNINTPVNILTLRAHTECCSITYIMRAHSSAQVFLGAPQSLHLPIGG